MKPVLPILNEISLSYSRTSTDLIKINTSEDAYNLALSIYAHSKANLELKEYFFIILLDRANHVLGYHKLSEGGITGTVADLKLIFATAIKSAASGLILLHNHPSGNIKPSQADIKLTEKVKSAGQLLDIEIIDHLIVTTSNYYSFVDEMLI